MSRCLISVELRTRWFGIAGLLSSEVAVGQIVASGTLGVFWWETFRMDSAGTSEVLGWIDIVGCISQNPVSATIE